MPSGLHYSRTDTMELKNQIEKKLGQKKAKEYFNLLNSFFASKISKPEFNKLIISLIGRETISLHNDFLIAIMKNATLSKTPPQKETKVTNGYRKSCEWLLGCPRKGRTPKIRDHKFMAPSPLGPLAKVHSVKSVEESDEVEECSGSQGTSRRSPIRAPLGVSFDNRVRRKVLRGVPSSFHHQTCYSSGELPDVDSLQNRLKRKFEMEGLEMSTDSVNVLNKGLNVYLKRLVAPCLDLSRSRSCQNGSFSSSMSDFRVAMGLNPKILGPDSASHLEKISLC